MSKEDELVEKVAILLLSQHIGIPVTGEWVEFTSDVRDYWERKANQFIPIIQKAERERIVEYLKSNGDWILNYKTNKSGQFWNWAIPHDIWQALKGEDNDR